MEEQIPWKEPQVAQPGQLAYLESLTVPEREPSPGQPESTEQPRQVDLPYRPSSVRDSWSSSVYSPTPSIREPSIRAPSVRSDRIVGTYTQWPQPEHFEHEPLLGPLSRQISNTDSQRTLIESQAVSSGSYTTPGEQDYEAMKRTFPIPGQRKKLELPRGVHYGPGPIPADVNPDDWLAEAVEATIVYHFHNRDLLIEAMESPESGIVCVGRSNRQVPNGNKPLAEVGKAVMELVMKDYFYQNTKIDEADHRMYLKPIEKENLVKVGNKSNIQRWIRPRRRLAPSRQRNLLAMMGRDVSDTFGKHDAPSTIERAMQALIGAVYYDGGIEVVKKVMMELRLLSVRAETKKPKEPVVEEKRLYQ
ncbi:hypothetical protein BDZ45DRAFT_697976 [Acephala macrosclerotiorum]|nr:hypothetical protein BDZ45DRAFT_697976 [Acephala macrosclerotiorum]